MARTRSLRAPLLWTGYVLLPATGWWLFHGVPVGVAVAVVLFAIWWTWRIRGALPGPWTLIAVLLIVKLLGGVVSVERGLGADYFANGRWAPPVSFTRIDRRLVFGGTGTPGRETVPFSVAWQGYVRATRGEDRRTFYLRGKGVNAELWVDGAQTVHLESAADEAVDRAPWPAGLRRLTVRLSGAAGANRQFEAGFIDADGKKHPFGVANVVARPYPQWRLAADRIFGFVARVIDGVLLAVLFAMVAVTAARMVAAARIGGLERREAMLALSLMAIMASGLVFAMPSGDQLVVPGDPSSHQPLYYLIEWILVCGALAALIRAVDFLVPPEAA